jgi:TP901 family phage tail tape measure protein
MSDVILPIDGDLRPLEAKVAKFASRGINLNLKNSISQPLGRITGQVSEFNKSLEASNARVLAFGASAGAVYAVGKAFSEIIKSTIEVEKQLADINVVLNTSQKSLANFGRSLFDIARNTANPFSEVSKAATEFARQGLGVQETLKRTSDALVLSRLSGLDAAKSVDALTAAVNSFSKAGLNSTQIINKLANVDAGFAVSSADLAEAISRVGSTAQDVGVDLDQLIALVTAAQQTTARGGAVIGNSLKTIFTRLQRTDTLDKLEELGVKVRDLSGETLPAVQVLQNLSKSFNALSQSQKSSVAETVGGVYQINILRAALGDLGKAYSIYGNALDTSRNSTNQATRRNEELNKTVDAQLKTLVNSFTQASTEIGGIVFAPTISKTTNLLNDLLSDLQKPEEARSAGSQIGTEVLKGLGTFVSGPGLAIVGTGFIKIFSGLAKFSAEAFKGFLNIQSGSDRVAAAQERINSILAQNPSLIEAAIQKQNSLASVEQRILQIIEAQNAARLQATQISNKLAPTVIAAENVAVRRSRGKAGGFIPNFAASSEDQMIEDLGASKHGYKAGKAYRTTLYDGKGGSIPAVVNSAERRKDFINSDGKKASLVIPPNGFSSGFIPNFARESEFVKNQKLYGRRTKDGYVKLSGSEAEYGTQQGTKKLGLDIIEEGGLTWIKEKDYTKLNLAMRQRDETLAMKRAGDLNLRSTGRGGKGFDKLYNYSLIYPGAGGTSKEFPTYGTIGKNAKIGFTAFPFPLGKGDFGQETVGMAKNALVDVAKKIVSDAGIPQKVIAKDKFTNTVRSNLGLDAVNSLIGQSFEAGLLASVGSIANNRSRNLDLSSGEMRAMAKNFPSARKLAGKKGGDFKSAVSPDNLNSMALKIAKAEGLALPSQEFSTVRGGRVSAASGYAAGMDKALSLAIRREKMAGIDSDRIKVGKDASLISDQNPLGLGVYNTKDEPAGLRQGISRYGSSNQAKLAGMARGFIPNFAQDRVSGGLGDRVLQFSIISSLLASQAKTQAEGAAEREKEKGAISELTKSALVASEALEGFGSGAFIGSLFGKTIPGAVAGGLSGAYSGANKINMSQFDGEIQNIKNKVGELNDAANNLDGVVTNLAPDFEKLISAMDSGEDISEYKKAIIDKINLDKSLTAQMKTSAMSAFNKDPRSLQPFLTQTSNQMRDEAGIRAISASLRETNVKNSTPSLADRFMNRVPDNLPFGIKNQLQNVLGSKPEINKNLATQDSATNLMLGSLSSLSMKLDNKKFMDLSKVLVDNSKNAEGFVNALISARKSIGDATDDLDELKESLKLDKTGVVGKNIVAGGLNATGQFLNQKAERASGLSKRGPGRPGGFRSNLAGVSQIYNLDYSDPLAMSDEGQADLAKGYLSQSENPLIGGNATLSLRDSLLSQGISEEDIAKQFPEFNKNIDEAIAAKQQQKEGSLRKIFETINKGKPLTKEQEALIKPKDATRKELVGAYRKETAEKIMPTTTTKVANGPDVQTPVSRKDLGTTYVPPVMPPAPTAEELQAQNDVIALTKTSAEVNNATQENPGVIGPVNQNNGFSLNSLLESPMVGAGATGLALYGLNRLNPFGRRKNAVAPEISQGTTSPSPSPSPGPKIPKPGTFRPGSPLPKGVPLTNLPTSQKYFPTAMKGIQQGRNLLEKGKNLIKPAAAAGSRLFGSAANVGSKFLGSAATGLGEWAGLEVAGLGASLGYASAAATGVSIGSAGLAGYGVGTAISNIPVGNDGENVGSVMGNAIAPLFGGPSKKEQERQIKQGEYLQNFNKVQQAKRQQEAKEKSERDASRAASQKRLADATKAREDYNKPIDPLRPSIPPPPPAPSSTKGLFQETYASQAFPGVKGLSDQATPFSYGDQFFKSQEDLTSYRDRVKMGTEDPIKQAQEAKREKINQQAPAKEEDRRSYDQEDAKIEKERKKQEEEIKKQAAAAEKATMTPEGSNSNTSNINVAPVITLNAGANQDELIKLVTSKVQEFAQNLMTEIDQKMSDRDKGNVNPPRGMTSNNLTG